MAEQNLINFQILLKFLFITHFCTLWSAEAPMKLFPPTRAFEMNEFDSVESESGLISKRVNEEWKRLALLCLTSEWDSESPGVKSCLYCVEYLVRLLFIAVVLWGPPPSWTRVQENVGRVSTLGSLGLEFFWSEIFQTIFPIGRGAGVAPVIVGRHSRTLFVLIKGY